MLDKCIDPLQVFVCCLAGTWSVVLCIGLHSSLSSLWWLLIQRVSRCKRIRKESGEKGREKTVKEGRDLEKKLSSDTTREEEISDREYSPFF